MKKIAFISVLLMSVFGGLFATDFSLGAGAGGLVGGFFTRYTSSSSSGSGNMTQKMNQFNYGGLVFFDATYGELALTIQGGANNYNEKMILSKAGNVTRTGDGWDTMLGFSLLGKYPFTLTNSLKLFPLLGIEYQLALAERRRQDGGILYDRTDGLETDKDGNAFNISTWNSFWTHVGVGTDFTVMKSLFLRGELLYSFRLMTAYEKDGLAQMKKYLNDNNPKLSGLTSGPSLRLSVGYRFWGN